MKKTFSFFLLLLAAVAHAATGLKDLSLAGTANQVLNGAELTFKSGSTLTIEDGATVNGLVTDSELELSLADYLTTAAAASTYLTQSAAASSYQPLDSDLTAIAALSTTSFGRGVLALADGAALRTYASLAAATHTHTTSDVTGFTAAAAAAAPVQSVAGRTGAVTLTKSDVDLSEVENTALSTWTGSSELITVGTIASGTWAATPIADSYIASAATWSAKEPAITSGTSAQYWRGDKSWQTLNAAAVGLGNVANVDTTKASNITSGTLAAERGGAGTVSGVLKADGSGTVSAASAADLPVALEVLTDSATITWDVAAHPVAKVTLGGNRTLSVSNLQAGGSYMLLLVQDGTGSRTITWPASVKWSYALPPELTTTAGKIDIVTFVSDGTNLFGSYSLGY